jgi:hypothetical protein
MRKLKVIFLRVFILVFTTYIPFYLLPMIPEVWYHLPTAILMFISWMVSVGVLVKPID